MLRRWRASPARRGWRWRCWRGVVLLAAAAASSCSTTPESYVLEARDGTLLQRAHRQRWAVALSATRRGAAEIPARAAGVRGQALRAATPAWIRWRSRARCSLNLRAGRVVSGGSTLTMQLARLARRPRAGAQLARARSAKLLLALRLEVSYDKEEILALYAAHAPFGGNVVGLEAAAWRYFGRDPHEPLVGGGGDARGAAEQSRRSCTWRATASACRPSAIRCCSACTRRAICTALDLDLALGRTADRRTARSARPRAAPARYAARAGSRAASHRDHARCAPAGRGDRSSTREHSATLARQQVYNAAALIVDNTTFEVLAYVGNSSEALGSCARLTPSTSSAGRAAPAAFSSRCCTRPCSRTARSRRACCCPTCPRTTKASRPRTSTASIAARCRADEALAHSLNVPAVRMLKTYGVARFADLLRGAGMSTLTRPADDYGLTLILGGAEGNLWDISAMYARLADIARAGAADPTPRFPRAHGAARPGRRNARPHSHQHRRRLAHARHFVRGAAPRRRRPLAQLRLEPPHRLEDRHQLGPARWLGGRQHAAATRWACGWAMPAAKAAPASPARPWPRR